MKLTIKGKNFDVSDAIRQHVSAKLGKLDRYLDLVTDGTVEITREDTRSEADRFAVQMTIPIEGAILRGEERAAEVRHAVDAVHNVMVRQISRYKGKLYLNRQKHRPPIVEPVVALAEPEPPPDIIETGGRLVRRKRYAVKPMSPEEALEQMELLGHDFFLFENSETGQFNVLYRRRAGDYGLIEPER
ncbi:MAG: ribosome-associated translation inhibitor RaiA [Chloroflexi bacterium]|nr:ribosome-associated translation inhibitor RaiA [Chloroflexota bacterium]